jgi:UDPglucose 6-dehydrogenase
MKLGFIGQGFVGKTYADYYEKRGFSVVRYALEEPYIANKDGIKDCDVVFIAVPTPTTPEKFDDSIVREAVSLVGPGHSAVIRSTILPGTTESIQAQFPDRFVFHAPEFLTARVAVEDAAHPRKSIVGTPSDSPEHRSKAQEVLELLPLAPHRAVVAAKDAEMIKYIQNNFFYVKNVYMGICYKLAEAMGCNLDEIYQALLSEPMMGTYHHLAPVRDGGYGAGGHCLPKDFEAFLRFYKEHRGADSGLAALEAIRDRNIELLREGGKDSAILKSIYGK